MKLKTTALCVALIPGLAMLAACNPDKTDTTAAGDMVAPADDTMTDTTATDTTAAGAETAGDMDGNTMEDDGMPPESMSKQGMVDESLSGDGSSFADMDTNGDGGISKDELAPGDMLYEHFAVADADGNGKLSEAEVAKHRADMKSMPGT